ncbi:hypothetical protein LTR36_007137 [Oleoguttula mirabilis]|uniref:Rad60/SUMO-like domain-containing protein n=1 Tax=Oleoguttula mirabilis TaxID=1507867 RepID=A0AAV9JAS5_9PEZI|nr:hypothetical protein LTR36_007137 [Oleoguttula mirabilis]
MSMFSRPAWAKTQESDDDQQPDEDLFSHSKRSYTEIVAEEQRKKKERAEKQKQKQERKERRSSGKRMKDEDGKGRGGSPKRRRITLEESEDLLGSVGLTPTGARRRGYSEDEFGEDDDQDISRRRSPRLNKVANRDSPRLGVSRKAPPPTVIELGGSDDEIIMEPSIARHETPVEVEEESDDEFAELARQARARRLKDESAKKSQTPDVQSPTRGQGAADTGRTGYPTPPLPDPPVKLFISSELPGTQALIVYRKLSQRLQEIRQVWCGKQGFSEQLTKDVYLIHRMRRLYDVTTCKSLGLYVNGEGKVAMKGAEGVDGVDQVHLEAVTDEIFAQMKARKAREERRRQGSLEPEEDAEAGASETQAAKEEELIRILLKAKGKEEPFKLKVKPTTLFSKIMTACRPHFKVGDKQSLFLEVDGERLDPDEEVQSTDIADMDCLDVHIV